MPTPQYAATSVVQAQPLVVQPVSIAPVMVIQQVHTAAEWHAGGRGLCDCFSDWEVCFWGTFFSPCLYGQLKARSGRAGDCYSGCCELTSVWVAAIVTTSVLSFIIQFAVIGDLTTGAPHNMSALQGLPTQIPALVNFLIVGVSRAHQLPPKMCTCDEMQSCSAPIVSICLDLFQSDCSRFVSICSAPIVLDLSHSVPLRLFSQIGLGFFAGKTRGSLQAQSGLGHISVLCDRSSTPYRRDREHIRWICF